MKRYLKRKSSKSNPFKQTNNINVNINLNVNMDNKPVDDSSQKEPPQVTFSNANPELKVQTIGNNTMQNNFNNNNSSQTEQQALNGDNIVIRYVVLASFIVKKVISILVTD